ncbi:Protein TOPLESS [Platanthera guangdongensis]|uniref:Protein TOPLESS n=1 Tax=Platanthera guangdongensis TaxID=2320717 RepID=A0ABR2MXW8_9ASPA
MSVSYIENILNKTSLGHFVKKYTSNAEGYQLLRSFESRLYSAARSASEAKSGDNRGISDVKPKIIDESAEKSKIWKLAEINEPSQCCSLRLPDNLLAVKPMIYGRGPMPAGIRMVSMVLPDGRLGYVLPWLKLFSHGFGLFAREICPGQREESLNPPKSPTQLENLPSLDENFSPSCFSLSTICERYSREPLAPWGPRYKVTGKPSRV